MAYETGGATNVDTLLQALATFAAAQGWTVHYNGNRTGTGAGLGTAIIVSKGGQCHTTFRTHLANRWVETVGHDAYNGALSTELQANRSTETRTNEVNGPFQGYHFFAGNTYLYVTVETTAGTFKHFGCGILEKFGTVSPGHFVYGTFWTMTQSPAYISDPTNIRHAVPLGGGEAMSGDGRYACRLRVDYDGNTNYWSGTDNRLTFMPRGMIETTAYQARLTVTSGYTQRAVLASPIWTLTRPDSYVSLAGIAPDFRLIMLDWLAPGDNLTLGSDVWKVFPVIRRNGGLSEPNSGLYGYAFKT